MSRQQRRARLKQSADAVSRHGINLDDSRYDQLWSMIGLTRILMDILGGRSATRASDAAGCELERFPFTLTRTCACNAL